MKSKILCIVAIKGGFGNQLFQYNFADYMRNQGFSVKIDNSFYKTTVNDPGVTNREQVLESDLFDFKEISKLENFVLKILKRVNSSNKAPKFRKFIKNKLFKYFKEKNFNLESGLPKIIYCDGYWQDLKFIQNDAIYIRESLKKISVINKALLKKADKDSYMIIVRRGDYIKMKQELGIEYYQDCFKFINKNSPAAKVNIFTDDIRWVNNQKLFNNVNSVHGPEDSPEGVLNLFARMLENKHFFIGNSTLSFFAALVGRVSDSKIYVADPWFRNRATKNLIFEDWIRIKNV